MSRYVFIPGAGGAGWYWHRVVPLIEAAGHTAIAIDLPADDPSAGLPAYADRVLAAIGGDTRAIVVAQSLGGFTAGSVAARAQLGSLIFVNAMIPKPGETPGEWWDAVGSTQARIAAARGHGYSTEFDLDTYFFHDVPEEIVRAGEQHQHDEDDVVFGDRCELTAWPSIPIRSIAGAEDRFFPVELQRRIARERLGVEIEIVPGGHLAALSYPAELAAALLRS